mgnify:FL=1
MRREHYARELAAAQVAQSRAARWQQEAAAWRAAEESERLAHTARLLSGEINTCAEWGEGMHVVMTRDTDVRWNSWPPADEPKQTMLLGDVWNVGGQLGGALISHGWAQKL